MSTKTDWNLLLMNWFIVKNCGSHLNLEMALLKEMSQLPQIIKFFHSISWISYLSLKDQNKIY